jgi:hypothetical protein
MFSRASPKAGRKGGASPERPLTRGALAARAGCNIETVRYYERRWKGWRAAMCKRSGTK